MKFYYNIKSDFGFYVDIWSTSGLTSDRKLMPFVVKIIIFYQKFDRHCIEIYFYDRVRHLSISDLTGNTAKMATQSDSGPNLYRSEVFLLYPVRYECRKLIS